MIIRIAVADRNKDYIERLINGLEKYKNLQLSAYTDRSSLTHALQTKRFDVLLFDCSVYEGYPCFSENILCILLYGDTCEIPSACRDFPKIKKYQQISRIYQNVLDLYADVCRDTDTLDGNRAQVAAFYSPIGGSGKTTLALAVATGLALRGFKTFYLNLEDMASEDCYLPQSDDKGISELLGYLEAGSSFAVKLQGLLRMKTNDLYYLNHFVTPNDIYALKEEELEKLLTLIGNTGIFDFMIIDMGTSMDGKAIRVFACADKIVLVGKTDMMAVQKLKGFAAQTHIIHEYGDKMIQVMNFETERNRVPVMDIPLVSRIPIMNYPEASSLIRVLADNGVCGLVDILAGGEI